MEIKEKEFSIHTEKIFDWWEVEDNIQDIMLLDEKKKDGKIEVYNTPISFDIETTNFYDEIADAKLATMYVWQFGIKDYVFMGRTWDDYKDFLQILKRKLYINPNRRIIVYIHNLAFEFQFLSRQFEWEKVFSIDKRKPLYALTNDGIMYKCSYRLSGKSLKMVGDGLTKHTIRKMSGDLDYSLIRNRSTPLSEKEKQYCYNDVKIVNAYIEECIEEEKGDITKIPLTKTGYVRRYCRQKCFGNGNHKSKGYKQYKRMIKKLTLEYEEYKMLKLAFAGGYTHASCWYSTKKLNDISSYDITSSYPTVMISEKYPMSKGMFVFVNPNEEEIDYYCKHYCCLFEIEFIGLKSVFPIENYLQFAKSYHQVDTTQDNGRVYDSKEFAITITDIDWQIIKETYIWKSLRIRNFIIYRREYLPTAFVKTVLELYEQKTVLKNVEGMEKEYLRLKELLNSLYGMIVTDPCREEIIFNEKIPEMWNSEKPDIETAIDSYNINKQRFLFYPWGVWVTAYARKNLWDVILQLGSDYVYTDTDSVKIKNREKHLDLFSYRDKLIVEKLEKALNYHKFDSLLIHPKNKFGNVETLGLWEYEDTYKIFKTLGSKRYMSYNDKKGLTLTIAGVHKTKARDYLLNKFDNDIEAIFDYFTDSEENENKFIIPKGYSGKTQATYYDFPIDGILTDYLGHTDEYHEKSCVNISEGDYTLSLTDKYLEYLKGWKNVSE